MYIATDSAGADQDGTSLHSFFSAAPVSAFGSFSTPSTADPPSCVSMISAESDRKSYAVTMPISRSFSTTGRQPI